jgi:hypothetical protein
VVVECHIVGARVVRRIEVVGIYNGEQVFEKYVKSLPAGNLDVGMQVSVCLMRVAEVDSLTRPRAYQSSLPRA